MKRVICLSAAIVAVFLLSAPSVSALDSAYEERLSALADSLSDEVKEDLNSLSVSGFSTDETNGVSVEGVFRLVKNKVNENIALPLTVGMSVIAGLILSSLMEMYRDGLRRTEMKDVFGVAVTLCVTAALITPVLSLIRYSFGLVQTAADFLLAFIPIMGGILSLSGHAAAGSGYCMTVMTVCELAAKLCGTYITSFLTLFTGVSVCAGIDSGIKLSGFREMIAKLMKWSLGFLMTVFASMLTIRSFLITAFDSVGTRAVRYTLSSFIPVVGSAVAEAYKTVNSSLNLLRTGAGVFVIIALLITFLPALIKVLLWMVSVNVCKAVAEALSENRQSELLQSVSTVLSMLTAILVSVMTLFIVSCGALIRMGGA